MQSSRVWLALGALCLAAQSVSTLVVAAPGMAQVESRDRGWEGLAHDAKGLFGAQGINAVAWMGGPPRERIPWIGDRFVAVGEVVPPLGSPEPPQPRATMWLSRDGRHWSQVRDDALPGGATSLQAPVSLDGALYVFGTAASGSLTAWRAAERGVWQAFELSNASSDLPFVQGALTQDGEIVVYGSSGSSGPTIWRSRDGLTWQSSPLPGFVTSMRVAPVGHRLVALAQEPPSSRRRVAVFVSRDGIAWREAASLGRSVDAGSETLGVWDGSLWAATSPRGGVHATSALWRSRDGLTWRRAGRAPRGALIDQLTTVDGRLVATGFDEARPGAWISGDARHWKAMVVPRSAGGRLDRTASNGQVVVAFGSAPELSNFYRWGPRDLGPRDDKRHGDPSQVPVPDVELPSGLPTHFDVAAWRTMWATTPGTARYRCVVASEYTEVRSGEFIVGNFSAFVRFWDGTVEGSKLYYVPLYPDVPSWPDDSSPLTVTADLLDGPSPHRVELSFSGLALGDQGSTFYVTGTVLPEAGTWRVHAVAGRNRGCFIVTV